MLSTQTNEPIIVSSVANKAGVYVSLGAIFIFFGLGLYVYVTDGSILFVGLTCLFFLFKIGELYKDDIYVTRKAIYRRTGYKKFQTLLFSELGYSYFENDDSAYLIFGTEVLTDFILTDDRKNYEELKSLLSKISREHLDHHGYMIADRSNLSRTDKLGCLDCKRKFNFSEIKSWTRAKGWLLKKPQEDQPICPDCRMENSLIISKSETITAKGLMSMNALRDGQQPASP